MNFRHNQMETHFIIAKQTLNFQVNNEYFENCASNKQKSQKNS